MICTWFPRSTSLFCESSRMNTCKCKIWTWMPNFYFQISTVKESLCFELSLKSCHHRAFERKPHHVGERRPHHVGSYRDSLKSTTTLCQLIYQLINVVFARAKRCARRRRPGNQLECAWFLALLFSSSVFFSKSGWSSFTPGRIMICSFLWDCPG